jgi:hypothetical protein
VSTLKAELPLPVDLSSASFDLIEGSYGHFQLSGLHGFEEDTGQRRVYAITTDELASFASEMGVGIITHVTRHARLRIVDGHAPST